MKPAGWLFAMLIAATAVAQVREQVTVELIEVPVYVFAADGQPVRGLTKDSFELRVNGRLQPIEYFEAVDLSVPRAPKVATEAPARRPDRERRLYLLLFDAAYSIPSQVARAQKAAHLAVDHSNPETDLFAVATYTPTKGVQFASAFVSDRIAVHRAIQALAVSTARDPLAIATTAEERSTWSDIGKGGEIAEMVSGGAASQDISSEPMKRRAEDLLADFGDLAGRLRGLAGQKHVLYFSSGFDAGLLHGGASPTAGGVSGGGGLDPRSLRVLDEMFRSFRAAGVFLDAIDIAGMRSKWDNTRQMTKTPEMTIKDPANAVSGFRNALDSNDSLRIVSDGTGGRFIHDQNDLGAALTDLENAQQVVYILGFNRRGSRGGEVGVGVKGLPRTTRLSYRQGFGSAAAPKDVDPLQLADILVNDIPQSGLTLPIRAIDNEVEVSIPVDEVRAQLVEKTPYVDLLLYIFDDHGAALDAVQKKIVFDEKLRESAGPIIVRKRIDLPPGHYIAKAIARIEGTTSLGFAKMELTVK